MRYLYLYGRACRRVVERVAQQVGHHLGQLIPVGHHCRHVLDDELSALVFAIEQPDNAGDDVHHMNGR